MAAGANATATAPATAATATASPPAAAATTAPPNTPAAATAFFDSARPVYPDTFNMCRVPSCRDR